ncbi:MAG: hypothetical protein PUC50_06125 [Bacteroidales bacterium]|nr:hypothetical protein [Bacteroidales bacterium]
MSTTALSGLRDYLCDTLTPANMLWLSSQLAEYAKQQQAEQLPPPHRRYTMDEINTMLDEAERQAAAGENISNEEFIQRWNERIASEERREKELEEQFEMSMAV